MNDWSVMNRELDITGALQNRTRIRAPFCE
jgi:hypothetical protein